MFRFPFVSQRSHTYLYFSIRIQTKPIQWDGLVSFEPPNLEFLCLGQAPVTAQVVSSRWAWDWAFSPCACGDPLWEALLFSCLPPSPISFLFHCSLLAAYLTGFHILDPVDCTPGSLSCSPVGHVSWWDVGWSHLSMSPAYSPRSKEQPVLRQILRVHPAPPSQPACGGHPWQPHSPAPTLAEVQGGSVRQHLPLPGASLGWSLLVSTALSQGIF